MVKDEDKKTTFNVRIRDSDPFYANETGIQISPLEIILDFKCSIQIQDVGNNKSILTKHRPVILTPFHAKSLLNILTNSLKNYENKFGVVKKPRELEKAESIVKKQQKVKDKPVKNKSENNYFG